MQKKTVKKIQRLVKIVDKLKSENEELQQKILNYESNARNLYNTYL